MDVASSSITTRVVRHKPAGSGRRFWVVTLAIIAFEILVWLFLISSLLARHGVVPDPGFTSRFRGGSWTVVKVVPDGPAKDLHQGDTILSLNGTDLGWLGPAFKLAKLYPGQSYTLTVERGTEKINLRLREGVGVPNSWLDIALIFFVASLQLLSGLWLRLGGPRNKTAQLGSASFFVASIAWFGPLFTTYPPWSFWTVWMAVFLARAPRPIAVVLGWDFLSRFPKQLPGSSDVRIIRRTLYAVAILLGIADNLPVFGQLFGTANAGFLSFIDLFGLDGPLGRGPNAIFEGLVSLASCYVLLHNYRLLVDVDSRRKIRWAAAAYGFGAICLLSLCVMLLAQEFSHAKLFEIGAKVADTAFTVAVAGIPITLTYALVKHRVLGVRLIIRSGLQYLLAKNVLRLILFAPALIVLIEILRKPNQSISELVFRSSWLFYLLVMGTAAFSLRYRKQLSTWLDRRFFRLAIEEEETWVALADSMKAATTEDELAGAVARQLENSLQVAHVQVLFRSMSDGRLVPPHPRADARAIEFSKQLDGVCGAELGMKSVFEIAEANSLIQDSPEQQREFLVVPLLGSDGKNSGAFVLGTKKSDEPFSRKEREFLQAVAAQVVMAREVLSLKRSIDQESRQRINVLGRLDRENIKLLNECLQCGQCYDTSLTKCPTDGALLELTLPVERVIVGRYRLNRRLGAGGMGVVYQALDLRLNRTVALKIMTGQLFGNRLALIRFKREAQAIASLRHPNIVGVHDFDVLPAGGAFLVMDLVAGVSWRKHLQYETKLMPERVANWVEHLCAGVSAAHSAAMIHRDLKPENVVISNHDEGETAVILDFGLAKLHSDSERDSVAISASGVLIGTRSYMSPEQRQGLKAGSPADIYSIGVMTLETLSRLQPAHTGAGRDWIEQALARIAGPDSKLPPIFHMVLAENPEERIQTAEELGRVLSAAIRLEKPLPRNGSRSDDAETLTMGAAS